MIKVLRSANERYPWFLAITMGFIAISFIIGMGWWGFGEHQGTVVASVGEELPCGAVVGYIAETEEEFDEAVK